MRNPNWSGAGYKDWVGLSAAPMFWVASLICFVLGLAFKGDGVYLPGIQFDLSILFSIGLGLANTAVQIVGNDTNRGDLGMALVLMWLGSYMLGIGSNVNFLNQKIGLDSPALQFLVCWGLGVMIEVAPERLLVKFLRAIGILGDISQPARRANSVPDTATQQQAFSHRNTTRDSSQTREQRHQQLRGQTQQRVSPRAVEEPEYHSIGNTGTLSQDLPPFLNRGGGNGQV